MGLLRLLNPGISNLILCWLVLPTFLLEFANQILSGLLPRLWDSFYRLGRDTFVDTKEGLFENLVIFNNRCCSGFSLVLFQECEVETFDENGMFTVATKVLPLFVDLRE